MARLFSMLLKVYWYSTVLTVMLGAELHKQQLFIETFLLATIFHRIFFVPF